MDVKQLPRKWYRKAEGNSIHVLKHDTAVSHSAPEPRVNMDDSRKHMKGEKSKSPNNSYHT